MNAVYAACGCVYQAVECWPFEAEETDNRGMRPFSGHTDHGHTAVLRYIFWPAWQERAQDTLAGLKGSGNVAHLSEKPSFTYPIVQ